MYDLIYIFGARDGAGLTLEAVFRNASATVVGSPITAGIVDLGVGDYQAVISHPAGHVGSLEFRVAGGGARQALFSVNPQEAENLDTRVSTLHGLLGKHSVMGDAVYSGPNLLSFAIRVYDTAAHAQANDGTTGLLARYTVTNTFQGVNVATSTSTLVGA